MLASAQSPESCRFYPADWETPFSPDDLFPGGPPLEVDIGCGKGRFLVEHAARNPGTYFLGLDRMLRRIRKVDRLIRRRNIQNVRLMRMGAYYAVAYLLPHKSVSVCYIFFPDPWPKKKHHDHRLFNAIFLDALVRILLPGGHLHFATDHLPYFDEVHALLRADSRFSEVSAYEPPPEEKSDFELQFQEKPIGRCSFILA